MRQAKRRLPVREFAFLVTLLGAAAAISWASGRTLVLAEILAPVLGGVQSASSKGGEVVDRVKTLRHLEEENTRLAQQIGSLEGELRKRDEQAAENARLHQLLAIDLPLEAKPILVARVVGRSPDNWHQRLVLDRGNHAGLVTNAVIINHQGLIGKVVALGGDVSLVSLLTDPASSVAVLNSRTRSAGVVQGQGDPWPVLRYMEQPEKWKVGDRLVTSGLGGIFPKGLLVGRIVRLKSATSSANALFPEQRVQPAVELDKLEEVVAMPPAILAMPAPPTPSPAPSGKPAATPSGKPAAMPSGKPAAPEASAHPAAPKKRKP